MIMNDLLAKVITTIGIIFLTEFIVRVIAYNTLSWIFPNRKWKTIRRMMKKNKFSCRMSLSYLLKYDNSYKTKLCIIICYAYRILAISMVYDICFANNILGEKVFFLWCILLVVPSVVWLRRNR